MDFGQPPRPTTPNTVMYDDAGDSTDLHHALAKKYVSINGNNIVSGSLLKMVENIIFTIQ